MTKSVQLQVAADRFIKRVLPKLFEHPGRAISEAMQNSRRAGASEIRLQIAADPSDPTRSILTIADDGSGILDWSSLMIVAQSGWDSALADQEDAFGVGFAALLFSAQEVLIRSRGRELRINQDDAVSGKRFAVTETRLAPAKGTFIRLEGYKLNVSGAASDLKEFAAGFPLPVHLGADLLPAPNRLGDGFVDTAVGRIRFEKIGAIGLGYFEKVAAYYQGLPIRVPLCSHSGSNPPEIVIHIDEQAYAATSPDRTCLCDSQKFLRDYEEAVRKHWAAYLRDQFRGMLPEHFVDRYWGIARRVGCEDLLDKCPLLPESVLAKVNGFPILADSGEVFESYGRSVTRAEVESGAVLLVSEPGDMESDDGLAFLTLATRLNWAFVTDLPSSHWARPHVISLDDVADVSGNESPAWSVQVGLQPKVESSFSGRWVEFRLALVDRYSISLVDACGHIVCSIEEESYGLYWEGTMIVPAKEQGEMLVRQVSYYEGENDCFLDNEYDDDNGALQDLIAELRGRTVTSTVHKLLASAGVVRKPGVAGSVCVVIFGSADDATPACNATHVIELSPKAIDALAERYPVEAAPLADLAMALVPLASVLAEPNNT